MCRWTSTPRCALRPRKSRARPSGASRSFTTATPNSINAMDGMRIPGPHLAGSPSPTRVSGGDGDSSQAPAPPTEEDDPLAVRRPGRLARRRLLVRQAPGLARGLQVVRQREEVDLAVRPRHRPRERQRPPVGRERGRQVAGPGPGGRGGQGAQLRPSHERTGSPAHVGPGPFRDEEEPAVPRPGDPVAERALSDLPFRPSQRGDDHHGVSFGFGRPQERDLRSVRRPGREPVVGRVVGQPHRDPGADELHVDVEVVLLLAVPREGHLLPVGRERRLATSPS